MKSAFTLILAFTLQASAQLNRAAVAAGKLYLGTATNPGQFTDAAYAAVLNDFSQFGQITAANSMKWDATEPSRGTFTFAAGDQVANLARRNGQRLRGAKFSWDVINEPFNDDGSFRNSVFFQTLGTSYIATALRAARAADPAAKLYINDFNIEGTGAKSTAMVNLVRSLQAQGVPIDGVGIQAHLIVGQVPSTFEANLRQFTALGVEVAITELDPNNKETIKRSSERVKQSLNVLV
ncbi:hypothetical protein ONZ45_g3965 [Pleurotus djamor]|nr:hypothetical protein ONZ45_g3965 [Pleurotus djamor]